MSSWTIGYFLMSPQNVTWFYFLYVTVIGLYILWALLLHNDDVYIPDVK
ncbi:MAG: hypothetical protein M1476_04550 [Candidatus Thermoplasmatota archaeon]|nr:hypothetical protein [Candidatus Thermoplasmatota archaeon]